MTEQQPSTDQTGTWEPDIEAMATLIKTLWSHDFYTFDEEAHAVIANYREQQRRAGVVEVRREDLEKLVYHNNYGPFEQNEARVRIWKSLKRQDSAALAAAQDQGS